MGYIEEIKPEAAKLEDWTNCIRKELKRLRKKHKGEHLDIDRAKADAAEHGKEGTYYREVASAILMPDGATEDYLTFAHERKGIAWIILITEHFGASWGALALLICEVGY